MTDRGAFAGPIRRVPTSCYDCGTEPGRRHAVRCALSPSRWALDFPDSRPNVIWGPLYFTEGGTR